ncbi:MAG: ParB N-terminal domain-containing protein [Candidatus Coproplasma sp.]
MEIIEKNIEDLIEYENNPRNNDGAVEAVAESIKQFGFKVPVIIDADGVIVAGHTRKKAALKLGLDKVPCIIADDLTPEQIKAFRLADNKTGELAEWDFEALEKELAELTAFDVDMSAFGFDESIFDDTPDFGEALEEERETLQEKYIIPPFSVFDTKQGYWQDRKDIWKKIIKSDEGRDEGLLGKGLKKLVKMQSGGNTLTGTSIFDPVLCEVLINWFCPIGGKILDPFAGGSVRGLISVLLGNEYTGIDLSEKQIKANIQNYNAIADRQDLNGDELRRPNWINDDSTNIDILVKDKHDFMLTCPPYVDLEVYSDDPRDISNMSYPDFKAAYFDIIQKACDKLKDNAFAAIVVGEVRDKKGYYYDFVGDTVEAFRSAGLKYYNECILLNAIATAALRADIQFKASRKVVKTHQNVLIFLKGNEKEINLRPYDYNVSEILDKFCKL